MGAFDKLKEKIWLEYESDLGQTPQKVTAAIKFLCDNIDVLQQRCNAQQQEIDDLEAKLEENERYDGYLKTDVKNLQREVGDLAGRMGDLE